MGKLAKRRRAMMGRIDTDTLDALPQWFARRLRLALYRLAFPPLDYGWNDDEQRLAGTRRRVYAGSRLSRVYYGLDPCVYCGMFPKPDQRSSEHVLPRAHGGWGMSWDNKALACRKCNGARGARPLLHHLLSLHLGRGGKFIPKAIPPGVLRAQKNASDIRPAVR